MFFIPKAYLIRSSGLSFAADLSKSHIGSIERLGGQHRYTFDRCGRTVPPNTETNASPIAEFGDPVRTSTYLIVGSKRVGRGPQFPLRLRVRGRIRCRT